MSQYRLSHSLFCCLYCEEQKLSATSVGVALCLCVKLSDKDVMTLFHLSPGTEKMLRAAKRWPWVMHHISLKHFFLANQMEDETVTLKRLFCKWGCCFKSIVLCMRLVQSAQQCFFILFQMLDYFWVCLAVLHWTRQKETQHAHFQ